MTMSWQSYGLRKAFFFSVGAILIIHYDDLVDCLWNGAPGSLTTYICVDLLTLHVVATTIGNYFAHFLKIHFRI